MGGHSDDRAASEVLGAILVFSFLVAGLGIYQAFLVPNANEDVEFTHNQQVQGQLLDVRQAMQRSAADGTAQTARIDLGVRYPSRTLSMNPSAPGGTLRVEETGGPSLVLRNVTTDGEAADYWDGDDQQYSSGAIVYSPSYNVYDNAPETVIENTVVYNDFTDEGTALPLSGQRLVSGREIRLATISGDISTSRVDQLALDVAAASAPTQRVTVRNTTDGNITIEVPTRLSEEVWVNDLLAEQLDGAAGAETCAALSDPEDNVDPDAYIQSCSFTTGDPFNTLTLTMEPDETYSLRLTKIAIGNAPTETDPAYLTTLSGDDVSVPEEGEQRLVLQVRDTYNNPVSGVPVNLSVGASDGFISHNGGPTATKLSRVPTDSNGKVTVTYHAPAAITTSPLPVTVDASFVRDAGYMPSDATDARFDLRVINATKVDKSAPLFNPGTGVVLNGSVITKDGCSSSNHCHLNVTLENTDGEERTITDVRYVFYSADSQGNAGTSDGPKLVYLATSQEISFSGSFIELDSSVPIAASGQATLEFEAYTTDNNGDTTELDIDEGEFFVISVIYDDAKRETYFVAPQKD